ncbi:hypothetical protein EMMF5_006251 [Cystobasidiomycetes sp. EMM_F5]
MPSERTCIVIGGGVSGLKCAADLVHAGFRVSVLEARDRIGGRTHTYSDPASGAVLDLGGSFIHGLAGNPLYAIAKANKLRLVTADHSGSQSTYLYSPEGPPLPQSVADRLSFNSQNCLFNSSAAYAQESRDKYPEATESLASYILDDKKSTLYDGLNTAEEKTYAQALSQSWDGWIGASLSDTSLRYWRSDVNYEGPDAAIADGYCGIYRPLGDVIRQATNGSQIVLQEEVVAVEYLEGEDSVRVTTKSVVDSLDAAKSKTYVAAFCICTLPLGVLQKRPPAFDPALPRRRVEATHRIGTGLLNKIILTYSKCFWPEQQSFISLLPSSASEAFLPILRDRALIAQNYKLITGKNQLVFYCGAAFGEALEKLSDDYIKESMHTVLKHHFAIGEHANDFPDGPESIIVTRWLKDPYSHGSYTYVKKAQADAKELPTPFDYTELARSLWSGRLGFAGEATDPLHYVREGSFQVRLASLTSASIKLGQCAWAILDRQKGSTTNPRSARSRAARIALINHSLSIQH